MKFADKKVFYNYFEKFLLEINRLYINFFIIRNPLIISGLTVSPGHVGRSILGLSFSRWLLRGRGRIELMYNERLSNQSFQLTILKVFH